MVRFRIQFIPSVVALCAGTAHAQYGMGLPDGVLKKVYSANADKLLARRRKASE